MCDCRPNLASIGRCTYRKYPSATPQSAWHGRNLQQSLFNYGTHGSYAGRSRPGCSSNYSPYGCGRSCRR